MGNPKKQLLYSKGSSLAVHGDDGSPFWICKTIQAVDASNTFFKAVWYEQDPDQNADKEWTLTQSMDRVPLLSVIRQTTLKRKGGVFSMSDSEFKKNLKLSEDSGSINKKKTKGVKKVSSKVTKRASPKKAKVEKVKIDKSNPNWRLKPRINVTEHLVDPFFDSKSLDFPFVSTSHYSRLVIRAVLLKDKRLLQSLINDNKKVSDLNIRRSLADARGPIMFAILQHDGEALKALTSAETRKKARAPTPIQLIETVSTGVYNFKSLGIRHIRHVEASRGGREGNNALTRNDTDLNEELEEFILSNKICKKFVDFLIHEEIVTAWGLVSEISLAFYANNLELGLHLLKKHSKDTRFSDLHTEALSAKDWSRGTKGMKEASVLKKGEQSITPLHLAALNPNVEVFKALYSVGPNMWVEDAKKRTPVHYAAVSKEGGTELFKFLESKSASWDQPDSEGYTPFAIATLTGNVKFMEYILSKKSDEDDEEFVSKNGICGIDRPLKNSYCPIHLAAKFGKIDSLNVLLKHGVKVEKPLNAKVGKLTALMVACAHGHLDIVRALVEKGRAKVEATDKFKRTALTHAVMNGASTVASYLLRLGANPDKCDSSGNSVLHYGCAYGWYHCVSLLLEAGATPDPLNEWKISPSAIAFLRGHRGLGEYMLKNPGVCSNFRDSKGRTLLMHLLRSADDSATPEEIILYLTYLLNELKIDPQISDNENKNALHYLTESLDPFLRYNSTNKSPQKANKVINSIFAILKENGCNTCRVDNHGHLPLDYLLSSNSNELNFALISKILDAMADDVSRFEISKNNNLVSITQFIDNLQLQRMTEMKSIGIKLVDIYKLLDSKNLIDMGKYRLENADLLFKLCSVYSNFPSLQDPVFENTPEDMYDHFWEEARDLLRYFLKEFRPCLRKKTKVKGKLGERSAHSILLHNCREPPVKEKDSEFRAGFEVLFSFDKDLEAVDTDGTTCLIRSIKKNRLHEFRQYIAKGADIFVSIPEANPSVYERIGKSPEESIVRNPLIESVLVGNLEMFSTLISKGASFPPDYPIFVIAVDQVLQKRNDVDRMAILEKISQMDRFQESTTLNGFNTLHLSVQNSTDDFNINLEIESLLLKYGVNPSLQDDLGRIPLHYAFINDSKSASQGKKFIPGQGNSLAVIDPIEVVSMIIDGMNGELVDTVDENGLSPLHYAAFRGSTVCCMLLMEKGAYINRRDSFGNTPLTYALVGRHEATTITLLQKGADVNCQIYLNPLLMIQDEKGSVVNVPFKYLPSQVKVKEKPQFPMTVFEMSLLNSWLGVSYLILDRMEEKGLRIAEALEVAFKLQKHQLAKKLMLKQMNNQKLCELVSNKMNLTSALMKYGTDGNVQDNVIVFLMNHLVRAGNRLQHKDSFDCSALHYACLTNNLELINLLFSYPEIQGIVNERDKNGRTPLIALLWNSQVDAVVESAKVLFANGADPNTLCSFKKFDYFRKDTHLSTVNLTYEATPDQDLVELTSPLNIAVNFKCRPFIELLIANRANVNMVDSLGRTPFIVAVKSNDLDFVDYFWNTSGSGVLHGFTPPPAKRKKTTSQLSPNAKDNQGYNAVHHALFRNRPFDGAYDNKDLLKFLKKVGCDCSDQQNDLKLSPVHIAEKMRLCEVYKLFTNRSLSPPQENGGVCNSSPDYVFPYDVRKDAEAMFDILSKTAVSKMKLNDKMEIDDEDDNENSDEDNDASDSDNDTSDSDGDDEPMHGVENGETKPQGLSLSCGTLFKGHTTLLSKVMVQSTMWGSYNFYRMQIWKDSQKELYILFTNWGRWGDTGNFQNTPYGTQEQAVQEFEKIYKSKTGNDWSKRNEFVPKSYKYRQLDIESFVKKPRPKINFDLKSDVPSLLPPEVQTSINHISNVTMYAKAYKNMDVDSDVIPFGQINKKDIIKALKLLKEIEALIKEKDSLRSKEEDSKDALNAVLEDIQNKSNEYYYLMPVRDVADTRISPIESSYTHEEEFNKAKYLLELEFAERVLLGAQYRRKEMNPLDYIYHCLSVQMTPLKPSDEMSDIIMQYMYASKGAVNNHSVDTIFKVSKSSNNNNAKVEYMPSSFHDPSKLLWHGTKCINLLSILSKGLIVNSPYVDRSGETFGRGIYLADVYDKSFVYSDQKNNFGYILLCRADLGKTLHSTADNYLSGDNIANKFNDSGSTYDSVRVQGKYEPLARDEVHLTEGLSVPLGKIIPRSKDRGWGYINYNEYVIRETNRISTDYLIRIIIK